MKKHIYTDGGCKTGGTVGAWAYVTLDGNRVIDGKVVDGNRVVDGKVVGVVVDTTNNRMEMMAAIKAIQSMEPGSRIVIFSDSGYLVTGHNHPSYLKKWMCNGWINSKRKPVENQDLWCEIIKLDCMYDVQYVLIKGHSSDKQSIHKEFNDMVDKMCTKAMNDYLDEVSNNV